MNTEDKKCPDCSASTKPIKIVGKKTKDMGILKDDELEYTVPEARRYFWTAILPIEGKITAYMCPDCGRVLLYGQPRTYKGTWYAGRYAFADYGIRPPADPVYPQMASGEAPWINRHFTPPRSSWSRGAVSAAAVAASPASQ